VGFLAKKSGKALDLQDNLGLLNLSHFCLSLTFPKG
jgi:hypothetical protein